jgi:hypothetical protein
MPCSRGQYEHERFLLEFRRGDEASTLSILSANHYSGGKYGRFLNSQDGGKKPGRSLLKVGVQAALEDAGFDNQAFVDRGGIFEWSRERKAQEALEW